MAALPRLGVSSASATAASTTARSASTTASPAATAALSSSSGLLAAGGTALGIGPGLGAVAGIEGRALCRSTAAGAARRGDVRTLRRRLRTARLACVGAGGTALSAGVGRRDTVLRGGTVLCGACHTSGSTPRGACHTSGPTSRGACHASDPASRDTCHTSGSTPRGACHTSGSASRDTCHTSGAARRGGAGPLSGIAAIILARRGPGSGRRPAIALAGRRVAISHTLAVHRVVLPGVASHDIAVEVDAVVLASVDRDAAAAPIGTPPAPQRVGDGDPGAKARPVASPAARP